MASQSQRTAKERTAWSVDDSVLLFTLMEQNGNVKSGQAFRGPGGGKAQRIYDWHAITHQFNLRCTGPKRDVLSLQKKNKNVKARSNKHVIDETCGTGGGPPPPPPPADVQLFLDHHGKDPVVIGGDGYDTIEDLIDIDGQKTLATVQDFVINSDWAVYEYSEGTQSDPTVAPAVVTTAAATHAAFIPPSIDGNPTVAPIFTKASATAAAATPVAAFIPPFFDEPANVGPAVEGKRHQTPKAAKFVPPVKRPRKTRDDLIQSEVHNNQMENEHLRLQVEADKRKVEIDHANLHLIQLKTELIKKQTELVEKQLAQFD